MKTTLEKIKRYFSCRTCHGTGVERTTEPVPWSELTHYERGDVILNGGHIVRFVERPCSCQDSTL